MSKNMSTGRRVVAALVLSVVALAGVAAPSAVVARQGRAAMEEPAPYRPNPFRALYRFLTRLIGVHPNDGGQIAPPHPDA